VLASTVDAIIFDHASRASAPSSAPPRWPRSLIRGMRTDCQVVERAANGHRRGSATSVRDRSTSVLPAAGPPGYDPCIPPYPPDLNCADDGGPITVTGSDLHGLDADNGRHRLRVVTELALLVTRSR